MNIPTRLLILQRLTAHLEAITPANGYPLHDLTGRVYRGRTLLGSQTMMPALNILESPRPDMASYAGPNWGVRQDQWTILIQGFVDDDTTNPTDLAYWLAADVEVHLARITATRQETGNPLYPDEYLLGGLISSLEIAPPVVRPPENAPSSTAFFFLPVRLGVAVHVGKPYTAV